MARARRQNPERDGPERGPSWTDGFGWAGGAKDQIRRSVDAAYDLIREQMKGDRVGLGGLPPGLFEWGQAEDAARAFAQFTMGLAQSFSGALGTESAMKADPRPGNVAVAVQSSDGRLVVVRPSLGSGAAGGKAVFMVPPGGNVPDIDIELLSEPGHPPIIRVRVGRGQPGGRYDVAILGPAGEIAGTVVITVSD